MSKKSGHIPECQFRELLKYWKSEKLKKILETNTKNRKKLLNPLTASKKSFAVIRGRLEKDTEIVSSTELFVAARTRNRSRVYKDSYENTASKIAEMEEHETQTSANGQFVDSCSAVTGP